VQVIVAVIFIVLHNSYLSSQQLLLNTVMAHGPSDMHHILIKREPLVSDFQHFGHFHSHSNSKHSTVYYYNRLCRTGNFTFTLNIRVST
jgi:hypothetical protein